jgi:23S rRNA pseudouridine2605 synthase
MFLMRRPPISKRAQNNSPKKVGLARAISKSGFCSRSQAAELIRAGRVKLNGAIRRDPETPVHPGKDKIEIDRSQLATAKKIYFMLNKPRGVVTTASDEKDRETVYEYLPKDSGWIAPVGRLDKASEGLLLATNDSKWANRVTDPTTHLDKIYHVQIGIVADESLLQKLIAGVASDNGEQLRVKRAGILRHGERNSWLEIILDEGKNRQIRRIFEALGIEVLRLLRVAIGPLQLGDLAKGQSRPLTAQEKTALDAAIENARAA